MKFKFLIAEEFRPEANNKMTALGIFPDDTIILLNGTLKQEGKGKAIGLDRLSFLVTVSELEGAHNFKGVIFDPNMESMKMGVQSLGDGIVIEPGRSHSIVIEAKPFVIKSPGKYKFILYVDEVANEFPFEIRLQD